MEQLLPNTTTLSISSSHYIDDINEKSKETTEREWLEYVLNLDIIADAEYEQSIIRQRQSQSDTYQEEIYTFDDFQISQAILVEIWDEVELDQEANKLELHYKLSGEDPEARLNQLLQESGLDYSTLLIQDQNSISEEKRKLIDEIKTISNFWNSQTENYRQKFIASIPEFAQTLGIQLSVEFLLPNIRQLIENKTNTSNQKSQYREILFDRTSLIVQFLQDSEISAGYTSIKEHLLPLYFDYFKEIQPEQDHSKILPQFKTIVGLLVHNDKVDLVLPCLLDMLKDDLDEEKRVLGLQILDMLAQDFGSEICGNYLIYEIVSLQDDPVYRVRKETCKYLVNISKTVETEVFLGVLLPVFKRLCSDHIWGVRKQAVEILPQISEIAPDDVKCGALLEIFKKFSKDQSKWVKQATTQYLGAFIVSFKGLEQGEVLLQFYTQLANDLLDKKNVGTQAQQDEDDLFHCAFNFPAILLTLGKQSWPSLIPVYIKMTEDRRVRVRNTLSFSLHEVAKIIEFGSDLVPVFNKFITDANEVREGVLINLPEFISCLNEKEKFVGQIKNVFFERSTSWRQRVIQAQNLGKLSELIQPSSFDEFLSFLLELCADEVAEVRLQSCSHIWRVLKSYKSSQEIFMKALEQILSFQENKKYTKRQDFIVMCEHIMLNQQEIFEEHLIDRFCQLQTDPVVNVRIQLSMTLQQVYPLFKDNLKIQNVIKRLKFDSSRDIQLPLKEIIIDESQKLPDDKRIFVNRLLDQIISNIIE